MTRYEVQIMLSSGNVTQIMLNADELIKLIDDWKDKIVITRQYDGYCHQWIKEDGETVTLTKKALLFVKPDSITSVTANELVADKEE